MYLVERHIIKKTHSYYNECDNLCFQSKNIYNQGLYNARQHFFEKKKYLNYVNNYKITKEQECYNYLPTKVFCQTLRKVDSNFKSFFGLLKNPTIKNKIPNYLPKETGRFVTVYPKQALSFREFKKTGRIHLSKTDICINTRVKDFNDLKEVRIVPGLSQYIIEVVYEKSCKQLKESDLVASIDIGLNNLVTVVYNNGEQPIVINGRAIKSINQFYNKKLAYYKSKLKTSKTSKRIRRLTNKRNNKINDYLHKASHMLVNQLVSMGVSTLIIGKNTGMKQDINIGKKNNQNFVMAPIMKFADIINYKCQLEGIKVVFHEESYTSKCSFFDKESIRKHDVYMGKRIKRGLFKTATGRLVNADVNGAYNIMKKAIPNVIKTDGIEDFGVSPLVLTIKK